jgi:hypothetical protein
LAGFWKRGDEIERKLRAERPEPRSEFVQSLADDVSSKRHRRPTRMRVVFVTAVTGALALSLSTFGGLSYAASAVKHVAVAVVAPVTHDDGGHGQDNKPDHNGSVSSAQAQYGNKVTVCHHGITLSINVHALPAHLAHGDTVGACS